MKKNILLPLFLLMGAVAYTQQVMKIQGGVTVALQPGAELTVAGGVSLDAGSTLINNGVFTLKQNSTDGIADFFDNSFTAYNYGTGKFVFNSNGKQNIASPNNFARIDVANAGLKFISDIKASKWWLSTGIITTGNFKAIVAGTAAADLEAAPANPGFANSWINGNLRRYITSAVDSYQFPVGDSAVRHLADLDNLQASPLSSVNYVDAVFGPKPGTDAGLNAQENGSQYLAVNNAGVWHFAANAVPASGAFDLKLYLDGFTGLSDNNFASLQRPDQSVNAADWNVPAGSSINTAGSAGRLVSDGYALRKNIGSFGQFGIATTTAIPQGTGLQGVYYGGINLSGTPLLTRVDTTINFKFDWEQQPIVLSPAPGIVPEDFYSVRWTGFVQPLFSETYTFYTNSDDGIRVWVNNVMLIDSWIDQNGSITRSGSIALVAGQKYDIKLEFYEKSSASLTKLYWSSPSTPKAIVPKSQLYPPAITPPVAGTGLQGVYYNGIALAGTPLLARIDPTINFKFDWEQQPIVLSPAPGIVPEDFYSVRWTGFVQPLFSETYTFYTNSDDGIRLWVNNVLLIDSWIDQNGSITRSGTIALVAGQKYDIKIEFYEKASASLTKLWWSSANTPKAIVPQSQLFPPASGARMADIALQTKLLPDASPFAFTTAAVSPNPVKRGQPARLQINSHRAGAAVVSVLSSNGVRISNQIINLVKGVNTTTVSTNTLAQGLYLIGVTGTDKPLTVKLIVN